MHVRLHDDRLGTHKIAQTQQLEQVMQDLQLSPCTVKMHKYELHGVLYRPLKSCVLAQVLDMRYHAMALQLTAPTTRSQTVEEAVPDSDCRPLSSQNSCSDTLDKASQAACYLS